MGTDLWDDGGGTDLWDDGELGPEIVESDIVDVEVVYVDAAASRLDDAEQRQRHARLTGACPADYTNLQQKHSHQINACSCTGTSNINVCKQSKIQWRIQDFSEVGKPTFQDHPLLKVSETIQLGAGNCIVLLSAQISGN